jgi:hypothetical protein
VVIHQFPQEQEVQDLAVCRDGGLGHRVRHTRSQMSQSSWLLCAEAVEVFFVPCSSVGLCRSNNYEYVIFSDVGPTYYDVRLCNKIVHATSTSHTKSREWTCSQQRTSRSQT